ncbi:hypothetical protein D5086_010752 [Populus alba]|uniref:Cyclin-dependent kinase inhibitor domain-containing protein n=2 Tax=Populus alba TaxID=43335 RepID=A0A4U5MA53_POPAL|nr:cyclin-dependent kinase inhibitor 6-like [Populus alba]TKR65951.1 hypothetical protein D5086_0000315800 [Populus alba]
MVKVAAAQVGVTSSRASAQTSKRRSRHIRISIEFRSNVTNHRRRLRRQDVIIRSENPVPCKPDANSGDRTVTEERCSTSSPKLEDDDDDDALMSASCCSSNGSCDDERIKFTDLEEGSVEVETSMYYSRRSGERETTPTSSDLGEESTSENMDSTANPPLKKPNPHQRSTPAAGLIRITDEEIEKFFGEIQNNIPKCFKDKYNFDFDKDEPLEGRYEWARLNP